MVRQLFLLILIPLGLILGINSGIQAQESPDLHVVVNMVQLNVAVTDKNGNYITGLRPKDFAIVEDGIVEKAATFAEGDDASPHSGDMLADTQVDALDEGRVDLPAAGRQHLLDRLQRAEHDAPTDPHQTSAPWQGEVELCRADELDLPQLSLDTAGHQ